MAVLFLAALSLAFDFGNCPYPSRAHPFFTSGRLASGVMIPFALLYVRGLDFLLRGRRSGWLAFWIIAAFAVAMTANELWLTKPAFASPYNWFHLPKGL
ncbi:MAG: hypothetical protein HY300_10475 [Verrucomicrobia bacterium]|nr:hypothetical protein [Verrucomicrobiota bacterium]